MDGSPNRDKGTSFLRVFRILEAVIDSNRPLTAAEISERVGLPRPTTHRLCKMLLNERLLQYELDGKRITEFPAFDTDAVTPIYEEHEGFQGDTSGVREFTDLPRPARDYVEAIEEQVGVPVHTISVGPDRQEVIRR